ncbi:MAG: protein TolR [Gammaproteobacteria bacterium]|nr:protein TolR [Gammaproteobacteria bacterium]
MSHLHQPGTRRPMAEINVVPFIDVMLVLLVIFMITTPLLTQGVKVNLPKTAAKSIVDQQKEPLIVTVDSGGNFYFNLAEKPEQAIPPQTLSHLVTTLLPAEGEQERAVLVRGDQNVNYGKVMEAMALLQKAGAKSVGLITEPQQPNSSKIG